MLIEIIVIILFSVAGVATSYSASKAKDCGKAKGWNITIAIVEFIIVILFCLFIGFKLIAI